MLWLLPSLACTRLAADPTKWMLQSLPWAAQRPRRVRTRNWRSNAMSGGSGEGTRESFCVTGQLLAHILLRAEPREMVH